MQQLQSAFSLGSRQSSELHQSSTTFKGAIQYRYVIATLCMVGMSTIYCLRTTFALSIHPYSALSKNTEPYRKSLVIAYFVPYGLLSIAGGRLAEIYSAKWTIFFGNAIIIGLHYFTPTLLHLDIAWLIISSRVVTGLASGITYPATIALVARWSPPSERFILCGVIFGGIHFGVAVRTKQFIPKMGIFMTITVAGSTRWEYAFYSTGTVFFIWIILHGIYVEDYPRKRKGMSSEEVEHISESLRDVLYNRTQAKYSRFPWKKVLASPPFYTLLVSHLSHRMIYQWTNTEVIHDEITLVWLKDLTEINEAVLLTSPFFWAAIVGIFVGLTFSTMNHRVGINTPAACRIVATVTTLMAVFGLLIDLFAASQCALLAKPIIVITLAALSNVIQTNHIEISPNYSGTLMGITCTFANVAFVEKFVPLEHRRILNWVLSLFSIVALLNFILCFSTNVQPWNWNLDVTTPDSLTSKLDKNVKWKTREEEEGTRRPSKKTKRETKRERKRFSSVSLVSFTYWNTRASTTSSTSSGAVSNL